MIYSNTKIRLTLCSLILALTAPSMLEAYPYAYRRLVLKNGNIEKVVELISDLPLPEVPMANPKNFKLADTLFQVLKDIYDSPEVFKKLPKAKQNELIASRITDLIEMGPSEKSLIKALHKISSHKTRSVLCFGDGLNVLLRSDEYGATLGSNSMLSLHLPHVLSHKLAQSKNKGLRYVPSQMNRLGYEPDQTHDTLIKINNSNYSHIIVIGGGDYCKELNDLLIAEDYKLVKSIGAEYDRKMQGLKFKWKVFHHTPVVATYRLYKAANRLNEKLEKLDEEARKQEEEKLFRAIIEKRRNSKSKIKTDKDAEIIFDTLEQVIRGAFYLHRDLTQMIPPLSPKVWKHLGE